MRFQAKKDSCKTQEVKKITFDAADKKGRKIGASAWCCSQVLTPVPQEEIDRGWYGWIFEGADELNGATIYSYTPHGTRDGKDFGAFQGRFYFTSEQERDAAVAKYFANAEKRAIKKAATV